MSSRGTKTVLFAVLLSLFAGLNDASAQPDPSSETFLGRGYYKYQVSDLSNALTESCLSQSNIVSSTNGDAHFNLKYAKTDEEYRNALGMGASIGVKGVGYRVNGQLAALQSNTVSRLSRRLVASVSVTNGTRSISRATISPTLLNLAPQDFFQQCGTEYVSGVSTTSEFVAVFTITAETQEQLKQMDASLSYAGANISARADFSSRMQHIKSKYDLKVQYDTVGYKTIPNSQNADEVLAFMLGFPDEVRQHPENNFSEAIKETTPYAVPSAWRQRIRLTGRNIANAREVLQRVDLLQEKVEFAEANGMAFYPAPDATHLREISDDLAAQRRDILNYIDDCAADLYLSSNCAALDRSAINRYLTENRDLGAAQVRLVMLNAKSNLEQPLLNLGPDEHALISITGTINPAGDGLGSSYRAPASFEHFHLVFTRVSADLAQDDRLNPRYANPVCVSGPLNAYALISDDNPGDNESYELQAVVSPLPNSVNEIYGKRCMDESQLPKRHSS